MRLLRRSAAPVLAALLLAACDLTSGTRVPDPIDPTLDTWASALNVDFSKMTKLSSGVWIEDTQVGTGATATSTSTIAVYYEGWTPRGFNFDGNVGNPAPEEFALDDLIVGWQEGIPGMKVGGKRRLIVPSNLGFGPDGLPNAGIPGNANLLFDVELVSIK
jgi:FKBP-type peptidyl-prolyl cis-trans isomerase FkpA